ncbi:small ubiquitin-like modifier [Ectocarpus siliculosus]|uniref:Small ubiquitin-like modifier n=1 Tax=Ectocarpus siliculosus TaxID=2880 RepID=D8LLA0_ECTSI|nr:small ubiquitin-like modifier [Ectocarpus siliculosus]|eukprot:CBN77098.1 small ubiquitin-like modifier [Ectocarpus siliculosus]
MATPMKRVFDTYADRKGVCVTTLRFLLNGERVGCDDTPASLQLGHHDRIDCLREQPGPQYWPFPRTATTADACESQGVPGISLTTQSLVETFLFLP